MLQKNIPEHTEPSNGFTLIELSVVLVIVSILVLPLFRLYDNYQIKKKIELTKENINKTISIMGSYHPFKLPCPSDRSVPLGDPNYGRAICNLGAIPVCNASLTQGICQTTGSRDTDLPLNGTGDDIVIIGGIPIKEDMVNSIPIPPDENIDRMQGSIILDGWNRRLSYAVAWKLIDPAKTNGIDDFKFGVINGIDENGLQTAGITTPGDAQAIVFSHGINGAGAFEMSGAMHAPCLASTVKESENCDNDFTFIQGIGSYDAAGNNYLDDYSYFRLLSGGDLWYNLTNGGGTPSPHINNLNTGSVSIKTTVPPPTGSLIKLDVKGTINADTIRADKWCDENGTPASCMPETFMGSTPSPRVCPVGFVISMYHNGSPICMTPSVVFPSGYTGANCKTLGASYWVQGVLTNGCVICSDGVNETKLPSGC